MDKARGGGGITGHGLENVLTACQLFHSLHRPSVCWGDLTEVSVAGILPQCFPISNLAPTDAELSQMDDRGQPASLI